MRPLVVVLTLVASCGRFGFDPGTGDDTVPATCDAAPEPNDSLATATPLVLGADTGGRLCKDDRDVFSVEVAAGEEIAVTLTPEGPGWPTLEIVDDTDAPRGVRTYGSRLSGFADRAGMLYVRVAGQAPDAGTPYHLMVTKPAGRYLFIAPSGNDAGPATFAMPLQHFSQATSRLVPGDTLVVLDGNYTTANNDNIWASCDVDAATGTEAAPIRIVGLTDRKAFLRSTGVDDAIRIDGGCAYWSVEGLRVESQDNPSGGSGGGIAFVNTSHMALLRVLTRHNNRYVNAHVIEIASSSDVLVEDTEIYDFHRNGILFYGVQRATVRRVFTASRGRADIAGGFASNPSDRGDMGIAVSHTADAVVENTISEGNGADSNEAAVGVNSTDTHYFGGISIANEYGFISSINSSGTQNTFRTRYENCIAIDSIAYGFYVRSNMDASCTACTAINGQDTGWRADQLSSQPRTSSSHCINCLAVGNTVYGFNIQQQDGGWTLESANAFGNATQFNPAAAPEMTSPMQRDPQLGGCLVYQPANAPLRGAGVNGGTIGAEVVYRYQDGGLTGVPLWDPVTGAFPCGAVVQGVNDDPATSCIGIHQRLHVGAPDCPLPYPAL